VTEKSTTILHSQTKTASETRTTALVSWLAKKNGCTYWPLLYIPQQAQPSLLGRILHDYIRNVSFDDLIYELHKHTPIYSFEDLIRWAVNEQPDPTPLVDWVYLVNGHYQYLGVYKVIPQQHLKQMTESTGVAYKDGFTNAKVIQLTPKDSSPNWKTIEKSFRKLMVSSAPDDPLEETRHIHSIPDSLPRADTLIQHLQKILSLA